MIDGPINGELFGVYVEKVLAPTLAEGDIVVLDNLGSHKGKPARAAVRAAGAHLLFLPPYSPDLNPIEQVFAKLKHLVRKRAPEPSTRHGKRSATPSTPSPRTSARTTSKTLDMLPSKELELLLGMNVSSTRPPHALPLAKARAMPSLTRRRASSASPQRTILTHLPGSRSL